MSELHRQFDPSLSDADRLQSTLQAPTEIWRETADESVTYRFIRKESGSQWHVVIAHDAGDDLEIVEELTVDGTRAMHEHRVGARLELG